MKNRIRAVAPSALSVLILAGATGCAEVQTIRITNISAVPMEYSQAYGDETDRRATGRLQPGESTTFTIREGEAITLPGAMSIQVIDD
ncbi:MAG: hypothetical protein KDB18_12055 [Salinibacterium sp.]|nr:hypothetical protein [Salinibacterium sp.]